MVGPPARTRQTQVHSNPFHISNTNVRSVRGSASKRLAAKSPVSSSRRSATAEPERTEKPPSRAQAATPERPAPPRELPEGGAVPNAIDFRSLAIETTEDDQLQKENRMLRWKVQQLTATGELYRRKVENLYITGKKIQTSLQQQVEDAEKHRTEADEAALQTAAELAMVNKLRAELEEKHQMLERTKEQLGLRTAEHRSRLRTKQVDAATAETHLDKLTHNLSSTKSEVAVLKRELASLREERRLIADTTTGLKSGTEQLRQECGEREVKLRVWKQSSEQLRLGIRTLVSRLDGATADCTFLANTCKALAPSLASPGGGPAVAEQEAFFSPMRVPDSAGDITSLREANRKLTEEISKLKTDTAARLSSAQQREHEWAELCKEWEQREHGRESQWQKNLRTILLD